MTPVPEDAIAVVGISGRFPGARDTEQFWRNNVEGRCGVTRQTHADGTLLRARGELEDIASFDPAFFGMSSREALVLDPQHRLLLECAWEALADTGPDGLQDARDRRTAVFAGATTAGTGNCCTRPDPKSPPWSSRSALTRTSSPRGSRTAWAFRARP